MKFCSKCGKEILNKRKVLLNLVANEKERGCQKTIGILAQAFNIFDCKVGILPISPFLCPFSIAECASDV